MLAHRLRRWTNTDSTPGERPVPAGMCQKERKVFHALQHHQKVARIQPILYILS